MKLPAKLAFENPKILSVTFVPVKSRAIFPSVIGVYSLTIEAEIEFWFASDWAEIGAMKHRVHCVKEGPQTQGHKRLEHFEHVNFKVDSCRVTKKKITNVHPTKWNLKVSH